jgi:hypothetical protein
LPSAEAANTSNSENLSCTAVNTPRGAPNTGVAAPVSIGTAATVSSRAEPTIAKSSRPPRGQLIRSLRTPGISH